MSYSPIQSWKIFYFTTIIFPLGLILIKARRDKYSIILFKFLHGFKLGMTELTNRIRDTLMQNQSLLEVLSLDRKILEKPPNWNLPVQEELFSPLLL